VGNNIFSCAGSTDVWSDTSIGQTLSFNQWDHSPVTFSSASSGGGLDLYSTFVGNQASANNGARVTASPCP
jgi:hypothetical protein